MQNILKIAFTLLLHITVIAAYAQKLPNKQEISLRAPADIKIDGKTKEWDNKFQAYNHATDIFYTLSNDDANLYLTIQVTKHEIFWNLIRGGITFSVDRSGKNKDEMSIKYPIFSNTLPPIKTSSQHGESPWSVAQRDSIVLRNNKTLDEKSKYIEVKGITGIDSLISVYNEDGIKVAEAFDNNMNYNYELAIDLKRLGLSTNDAKKFAYHIIINGSDAIIQQTQIIYNNGGIQPTIAGRMTPPTPTTDFWAEYTLANKP